MSQTPRRVFRILFQNQGKSYELYARKVEQGELYGFVVIEELLFGERSSIVVDPSADALRQEFHGVRALHLPYHAIVRIEEVEREGAGKVLTLAGSGDLPTPTPPPGRPPGKH